MKCLLSLVTWDPQNPYHHENQLLQVAFWPPKCCIRCPKNVRKNLNTKFSVVSGELFLL